MRLIFIFIHFMMSNAILLRFFVSFSFCLSIYVSMKMSRHMKHKQMVLFLLPKSGLLCDDTFFCYSRISDIKNRQQQQQQQQRSSL